MKYYVKDKKTKSIKMMENNTYYKNNTCWLLLLLQQFANINLPYNYILVFSS